jgi:mono/diheme cytochrome c family protein
MSKQLATALSVLLAAGLAACGTHSKPNVIYMPDMVYSPAFKAQKEGAMRTPVKGTVPRGFTPYAYASDPEGAGRELKNPLARSKDTLARGQALFNTYCIVCHGPAGMGDGSIIPKFPRPPSLQSDKVRGWTDGRIYHVISQGQNLMPSYATQIVAADRWALIHYIRALQRSKHPTAEDLKVASQQEGN